jgi:RNA polymerase sigma-70 factor (ECF subfamily)
VARGEPEAVRECLATHGPLVWSLVRRATADNAQAEDAAQEIFIDLWSSAGRFDPSIASESTFVALIARRRLIDLRRRQGRRLETRELDEALPELDADTLRHVDLRDEARPALEALAQLSGEQQRVLTLSVFHQLTHDEIAQETGWPLGTVKTHARRGLIRLRQILQTPPPLTNGGAP